MTSPKITNSNGKCISTPIRGGGSAAPAEVLQCVTRIIRILRNLCAVKSGKSPESELAEKVTRNVLHQKQRGTRVNCLKGLFKNNGKTTH